MTNIKDKHKTSLGLGDTIEKITEATGIKKVVKFLFGEDCGCNERKEILNKWKPYIECLKHHEYKYLKEYFDNDKGNGLANYEQQQTIINIHTRVFRRKHKPSCSSCRWKTIHSEIKRVYNEY